MSFIFYGSDAFMSGPSWHCGALPFPGLANSELVSNLSTSAFQLQTNQTRAHTPTAFFMSSHSPGHHPPALITSQPGTRQQGQPHVPKLAGIIKLANPKPAYPASHVLFHGNHGKGSGPQFPLLLWLPTDSWGFPAWPALYSQELWVINYLLYGSCFLVCWVYCASNFLWTTVYFKAKLPQFGND